MDISIAIYDRDNDNLEVLHGNGETFDASLKDAIKNWSEINAVKETSTTIRTSNK